MQRLKTRAQFQAALGGATVARTAHFALHRVALDLCSSVASVAAVPAEMQRSALLPTPAFLQVQRFAVADVWLGAMVPKRWARRAVTRNAIKRQIYAVATALDQPLLQAAHVVRLRSTFDRKQFVSASSCALKQAVRAELVQLFARAAARGAAA